MSMISRLIMTLFFVRFMHELELSVPFFIRTKTLLKFGTNTAIRQIYRMFGLPFPYNERKEVTLIEKEGKFKWYIKFGNSYRWVSPKQFASARSSRFKSSRKRRRRGQAKL